VIKVKGGGQEGGKDRGYGEEMQEKGEGEKWEGTEHMVGDGGIGSNGEWDGNGLEGRGGWI